MKTQLLILAFTLLSSSIVIGQANKFQNVMASPLLMKMKANPFSSKCDNKEIIPINLPAGTKGWYYEVTVAPKGMTLDKTEKLITVVQEFSHPLNDASFNEMVSPLETTREANIYILRGEMDSDAFMNCGFFNHHGKFIGSTSKAGYIENTEGETFYLGIERPTQWKGLQIKIEVVAQL